jgi:hypothetical protein
MSKIKVGDIVTCVGDFSPTDSDVNGGGHGHKKGRVLIIKEVKDTQENFTGLQRGEYVIFGYELNGDKYFGVWSYAVGTGGNIEPIKYIKKLHMV